MQVSTRAATLADLPALRHLATDAFDREPAGAAALVDLLFHRPPGDASLRLVAEVDGSPVAFAFGSMHEPTGYVDALAVDVAVRRHGVATRLLDELEDRLIGAGAERAGIGGNTWFYAWPGIDLAYTAALSLAERRGYRRTGTIQNMDVALNHWVPDRAEEVLHRHGDKAAVRRASVPDWPALEPFVASNFTDVWRHEAELAIRRDPPTTFIATTEERITGFACHGVYRPDWFGPLGVDPQSRGAGIGEALLLACLDDLAAADLAVAQIAWIGPMTFYARTVEARRGRAFAVLEKRPSPGNAR